MNDTSIDYLTHSWNPIAMRCSPISVGCSNCWHLPFAHRMANNPNFSDEIRAAYAGETGPVLVESRLHEPLKKGKPARIGVQFMGDLYHPDVPDEFIDRVYGIMALAQRHRFIVLTKRPERMYHHMMRDALLPFTNGKILPNVIGMVTVENQETADERVPWLMRTPFAMKGISAEPLLGPLDITQWIGPNKSCDYFLHNATEQDIREGRTTCARYENPSGACEIGYCVFGNIQGLWCVAGGESGHGARPMHPDWARSLRDQCMDSNTSYFFKQWGEWIPIPCPEQASEITSRIYTWNDGTAMERVGKKDAGHLLDGEEWHQMPEGMVLK